MDGNAKNISRFDNRLHNPIVYAIIRSNYIRVIDNEGEDYLYPVDYFSYHILSKGNLHARHL